MADITPDFWTMLAARKNLSASTVNSYKSVLSLTTKNGAWALRQLKTQWPEADWEQIRDLTQLPEAQRAAMLDYLLETCGEQMRSSPIRSHLKKLSSALALYRELVLEQPAQEVRPADQETVPQAGPLSFPALLRTWMEAAGQAGPSPVRLNDWIRFLLRHHPDQSSGRLPVLSLSWGELARCSAMPEGDCAVLRECLRQVILALPDWTPEAQAGCSRLFRANEASLHALWDALGGIPPEHASPRMGRELERLRILAQVWPALYRIRETRSLWAGRRCLLQVMFSLLYGALGGEGWDWLPALRTAAPAEEKLLSAVGYAGAPLSPDLALYVQREKGFDWLYRLPPPGTALVWTSADFSRIRSRRPLLAQAETLSGALEALLAAPWMDTDPLRAQAVLALVRLLLGLAGEADAPSADREAAQVLDRTLLGFLACWRTPEQRIRLSRLLNPELARLESGAQSPAQAALHHMLLQVAAVPQEYIDLLRAAARRANLEPGERQRLLARADSAAGMRLLAQEGQEADHPPEPAVSAPPPDAPLCALWDPQSGSDYLRPYTSSAFDSARSFGPQETQMELSALLYRSARVVLTGPQVVDNPQILGLVWSSPAFLQLVRLGRITVSLFQDFRTLTEYTADSLDKTDRFQFSGYPVFQQGSPVVRDYLRYCMGAYLRAEDRAGRTAALRQAPFALWETLSRYGDTIRLMDEALSAQACGGHFSTLSGFFHQKTGWRSTVSRPDILTRLGHYLSCNLPGRQDLLLLHQALCGQNLTTRSGFYQALDAAARSGTAPDRAVEDYRVLTDLMYFEHNSARITSFLEHRVDQRYRDLMPPGGGRDGAASRSIGYIQQPLPPDQAPLTMEDTVKFVQESCRWAQSHPNGGSAVDILRQVLSGSRAVRMAESPQDPPHLDYLAYRVVDPADRTRTDLFQQASGRSSFLTLERRL